MARYVATQDSYSKQCRLYRKGQIYEFAGEPETPYFRPVDPVEKQVLPIEAPPVPPVEAPVALSDGEAPVPMTLAAMTKDELKKVAEARGLRVLARATRDEIIRAIVDADDVLK